MQHGAATVTVLMAEDEVLNSHLVADWLGEHGFAVHEVGNADAALRHIDAGGTVDVLFTDIDLPGCINGTELAVKMREWRPELPVVCTSGRYRHSGCDRRVPRPVFVAKPYAPDDVRALIARLTAR